MTKLPPKPHKEWNGLLRFVTVAVPIVVLLSIACLLLATAQRSIPALFSMATALALSSFTLVVVRSQVRGPENPASGYTANLEMVSELQNRTIEALVMAIDAKDQKGQGHIRRTQVYASRMGALLRVSPSEAQALISGALLHDIGKLAVPEDILNKRGKLTAAEFAKMKVHPTVGGDIIRNVDFPYPVEQVVRFHHEKWDGTGYPSGLKGEEIPRIARIISVVDFYDTTRCDRPYRKGMTRLESLDMLVKMSGSSFDPEVVTTFIENVGEFDKLISPGDLAEQIDANDLSLAQDQDSVPETMIQLAERENESHGLKAISSAQREVSALNEIATVVCTSLDLQDTLSLITRKLQPIVPFDTCAVYLVDRRTEKITVAHACGNHAAFFLDRQLVVGEGITGWVIANSQSMASSSPEIDLLGLFEPGDIKVRGLLSSPLVNSTATFGAITLYSETISDYSAEQIRLLEAVAQVCSSAVSNAQTFEKTRRGALTDGLTELPNDRAFYMILEQRLAESQRVKNQQLAVLGLDVNQFKKINDIYGHVAGDRVLSKIASVIKQELRQMDALARYSGDQFVAIMPLATGDSANSIVDRIKLAVESTEFTVRTGEAISVTLSAGISSFPDDGETGEALLAKAMERMRRSKQSRPTLVLVGAKSSALALPEVAE